MAIKRILYAAAAGDVIESHRWWKKGESNPSEVSFTFSGQIQDFCKDLGIKAYFVSNHSRRDFLEDGDFTFEHRPKAARRGIWFYLNEVSYGLGLLLTALRFRAQAILVDSGTTQYFVLFVVGLFGIRVVPILHNSLWPSGFPPQSRSRRVVSWLDAWFWRWIPHAVVAVSPECERQLNQTQPKRSYPVFQARAQFSPAYFAAIAPAPPHAVRPFQVMFIGRVERDKGVFDILEIARTIEDRHPGLVRWEICGRGSDLAELRSQHEEMKLASVVNIRGWTSLDDLRHVYGASHACIVPTRSQYCEGLAMTAAEAILAGRPLVTNPVVPALELLRPACLAATTNDVRSHLECVLRLATDAAVYENAKSACKGLGAQFYDRKMGFTAVLKRAFSEK